MFSNVRINGRNLVALLGVLAMGLAIGGQGAAAGDWNGGRSKPYVNYMDHEYLEMIDAIKSDHPVRYAPMNGQNGMNPYVNYPEHENLAMTDAINRDRQAARSGRVAAPSAVSSYTNPYLQFDSDDSLAILDLAKQERYGRSPGVQVYAPAYEPANAAVSASGSMYGDNYAHSYAVEPRG